MEDVYVIKWWKWWRGRGQVLRCRSGEQL